ELLRPCRRAAGGVGSGGPIPARGCPVCRGWWSLVVPSSGLLVECVGEALLCAAHVFGSGLGFGGGGSWWWCAAGFDDELLVFGGVEAREVVDDVAAVGWGHAAVCPSRCSVTARRSRSHRPPVSRPPRAG